MMTEREQLAFFFLKSTLQMFAAQHPHSMLVVQQMAQDTLDRVEEVLRGGADGESQQQR